MRGEAQAFFISIVVIGAIGLSGCTRQSFNVGVKQTSVEAAGSFRIAPKVDILIAQDNTGSALESYSDTSAQLPALFSLLDELGYDYRVATTPLTHDPDLFPLRDLDQIVASKFDTNWLTFDAWEPPFPGADPEDLEAFSVLPEFFRMPTNYSGFMSLTDIHSFGSGEENGFATIESTLLDKAPVSEFFRSDALGVVLVISNGNDTSNVNMCLSVGITGHWILCGEPGTQPGDIGKDNRAETFAEYKESFQNLIDDGHTADLKFYSVVSTSVHDVSGCQHPSDKAKQGYRYMDMATEFGGESYDICSQPISSAVNSLADHLEFTTLEFITDYVVLDYEPDPTQISIVKFIGGDPDNSVLISPEDAVNGWTYEGFGTYNTIGFPVPMVEQTGYGIQFHGDARPKGADTLDVFAPPLSGEPSS